MAKVGGLSAPNSLRSDPWHLMMSSIPFLVDSARQAARSDAHSYRDFRVGASVFAYRDGSNETALMAAGNVKARQDKIKICAEKKVLEQARKAGYTAAAALVVVGTTDVEEIKGVNMFEAPTLPPCAECRSLFCEHALVKDETLILSTGLECDKYQVHTQSELQALYENGDPIQIANEPVRYGFDNWPLRVAMFDHLVAAERSMQERTPAILAKMAMMAPDF